MTKEQLVAIRTMVALAEHHIRGHAHDSWRLEWTQLQRKARQAVREITHTFLDEQRKNMGGVK